MEWNQEQRIYRIGLVLAVIKRCSKAGAIEKELIAEFLRKKGWRMGLIQEYIDELVLSGKVGRKRERLYAKEYFWDIREEKQSHL